MSRTRSGEEADPRGTRPSGRWVVAVPAVAVALACGGAPAAPTPSPPAGDGSVSGTVVSVVLGAPIPGARVKVGDWSAAADGNGRFTVTGVPAIGEFPLIVDAPGHFQRRTSVRLRYLASHPDLDVDLIPTSDPFDYTFFRLFARNEVERGQTGLEPLRPWTVPPRFYIRTAVDPTGEIVASEIIERIATVLVNGVREFSGDRLTAGGVETGAEDRPAATGWVNVLFQREIAGYSANTVGLATIGGNQGTIWLRFNPDDPMLLVNDPSGCYARVVYVAAHEIRHTMGFYHTTGTYAALYADPDCDGAGLSEKLRYHGAVMYSRPRGNVDPDTDPDGFTLNATTGASGPVVSCSDAHVGGTGGIR